MEGAGKLSIKDWVIYYVWGGDKLGSVFPSEFTVILYRDMKKRKEGHHSTAFVG